MDGRRVQWWVEKMLRQLSAMGAFFPFLTHPAVFVRATTRPASYWILGWLFRLRGAWRGRKFTMRQELAAAVEFERHLEWSAGSHSMISQGQSKSHRCETD